MLPLPPKAVHGRDYVYYRRIVQRDPCSYCAGRGGTKDHIVPQSQNRALADVAENLTGACRRCNMEKGNLDLLGFLFERHWGMSLDEARLPLPQVIDIGLGWDINPSTQPWISDYERYSSPTRETERTIPARPLP